MTSPVTWGFGLYEPPKMATDYVAQKLLRGSVLLVLGAGVSAGMGLPAWKALVSDTERRLKIAGTQTLDESADGLAKRMSYARAQAQSDGADFLGAVRAALYGDDLIGLPNPDFPDGFLTNETLASIGALIMSSARGSIRDVITTNFDDVLEWYLDMHGFTSQVITEYPTLLRGDVDVRIHHIHGYLPLLRRDDRPPTDWIVLTKGEFEKRVGGIQGDPWNTLALSLLFASHSLFVGTQVDDIDMSVLLQKVWHHVNQTALPRPLGTVIQRSFDGPKRLSLNEHGLLATAIGGSEKWEELPKFLLTICRKAALKHAHTSGAGARLSP
jgi:hypothetical protein